MRLVAPFLIDDDDARKPPGLVREPMYMMRYSKVGYIVYTDKIESYLT